MLKSLTLLNFQAHKKLQIEFDPHVTSIVGPSDVGKSAIIRALRLVMLNGIRGDAFIRNGAKHCVVQLGVDDVVVTRERGKQNLYSLDDQDYKAFGNDVPDTIADYLQVNEINFQGQHDAPFWFSLSDGEVSRQLNQVINLSIIDEALSETSSTLRKARSVRDVTETRLEKATAKEKELAYAKEIDADLKKVEAADKRKDEALRQETRLGVLIQRLSKAASARKTARQRASAIEGLLAHAKKVKQADTQRQQLEEILRKIEKAEAVKAPPSFREVSRTYKNAKAAKAAQVSLGSLLASIEQQEKAVAERNRIAERAEKTFHERIKGQQCPICKTKMS